MQLQKDELKKQLRKQPYHKKIHETQDVIDSKLINLKEELTQNQNQESKKQNQEIHLFSSKMLTFKKESNQQFTKTKEDLGKHCKSVQTTIGNLTKQQGLLFNLVLDLKNVNGDSNQAQRQSETNESNQECRICLDKPLCIALVPCGHIVACLDCEKKLPTDCPTCRNEITGTLKVYLP